jgi:uncharacterized cupin superfamily protein
MADNKVTVEKPTPEKMKSLKVETWDVWECEPKTFDWQYDSGETFYVLQGKARVKYEGGEVTFGKGDLVSFPSGMKCVWTVVERIRKHYKLS